MAKTLISWTAKSGYPISSSTATRDYRNFVLVLDFDDTVDEDICFDGVMPQFFTGVPVTITIGWMATDTTPSSQDVSWRVAFASYTPDVDDIDTKGFTAGVYSTNNTEATNSGEIAEATVSISSAGDIDSIAAGEWFRMSVTRNATDAGGQTDSLTGDAELVYVKIDQDA